MTKKNKLIIFVFGLIALAFVANFALAQDLGLEIVENNIGDNLGVAGTDLRVLIARIVQIALSFLGIIALILNLYAGFLWMTSGGDEDKIDRAKKILRNAIIGLVIILSSWAITTYIISRFTGSLGTALNPTNFNLPPRIISSQGIGALGACSVENVYPENNQKDVARNVSIVVSFKEDISANGLCINDLGNTCTCGEVLAGKTCSLINPRVVRIYKSELRDACSENFCPDANSNVTDVIASVSEDKKTLVLMPISYLGDPTKNLQYSVKLTEGLKKTNGDSMFKNCAINYFAWMFEVSSRLDLSPPQVVYGSLFPRPDNERDLQNQIDGATAAQAQIKFINCPNIYRSSAIISVVPEFVPETGSPAASATPLNYQGALTKFKAVVSADSVNTILLFNGLNDSEQLGRAEVDSQGNAKFDSYFIFKAPQRNAGNSWIINLQPEVLADTLTIGGHTYIFSKVSGGNNIAVPETCDKVTQANLAYAVLSNHETVSVEVLSDTLNLKAITAGQSGNNININTSNAAALQITPFSGGIDRRMFTKKNDQKDVPMNTVIQLNFNEAVNPLQLAGLASEVAEFVRIVNYDERAKMNDASCYQDSDCKSYNCSGAEGGKTCRGNYLSGKFLISNNYKTLEFLSDKECGVNGCGEKIYCLPASSHLAVEMKTADLRTCETDSDCLALAPFIKCSATELGYKTCKNSEGRSYPAAKVSVNGIIDLALNSFDGNRNSFSDGPLDYYNDNYLFKDALNDDKRDSYRFSFYVNDQINLTPPRIEIISPGQNSQGIKPADSIKITWNTLMMNSTLRTGSTIIDTGKNKIEHKLVNLKSLSPTALGYWVVNDNIDTNNDGEPDKTISWVKHSPFSEAMTYKTQIGSGVKDIYQNCFKPSDGDGCTGVSLENPSCCFGQAVNELGPDGNCK